MSKETTDWFAAKTKETDATTAAKGMYGRAKCVRGQANQLKLDGLRNVAQCEKKESCSMEYDAMVKASTAEFILNATQCTDSANNILTYDFQATCKKGGIDPLSILTLLFILTISFAMGTTIVIDDFKMVWREKKRGFVIGLLSQYGFMPLISYALCFAFGFSNTAAIGVMLCGMMPGGSTSNLFTYWAKGNIALSMAMSAVSTIFACFMIPLLYLIFVQTTFAGTGAEAVKLPALNFIMAIVCLMIPIPIGMLIRHKNTVKQCGCGCLKKPLFIYKWIEKIGGFSGAVFLLVAVIIGVLSAPQLISNPRIYWRSWVLGSVYQPIGCIFG